MPLISQRVERMVLDLVGQESLGPETRLFSTGLLDSFHLIELVEALEVEFAIAVGPSEFSLRNFDSIEQLASFVAQKRSGHG